MTERLSEIARIAVVCALRGASGGALVLLGALALGVPTQSSAIAAVLTGAVLAIPSRDERE